MLATFSSASSKSPALFGATAVLVGGYALVLTGFVAEVVYQNMLKPVFGKIAGMFKRDKGAKKGSEDISEEDEVPMFAGHDPELGYGTDFWDAELGCGARRIIILHNTFNTK